MHHVLDYLTPSERRRFEDYTREQELLRKRLQQIREAKQKFYWRAKDRRVTAEGRRKRCPKATKSQS